jgi:hypothetical protein
MAFPGSLSSTEISDIVATTIENRSGVIADNLTNNNALLSRLKKRGKIKTVSGGDTILQELSYADSATDNASSYSGYEVLNITPSSPISAARYDIKQYASAVTFSGLDLLRNSGKEQVIDLIEARTEIAESRLINLLATDIYGDGTGNGGRALTGLQAQVLATGTVGSISATTYSWWASVVFDATTDGGTATTSANIQSYMNRLAVQLVRGTDSTDLIVADNTKYRLYLDSLQAIQRVQSTEEAGAGFTSLMYYGSGKAVPVVLDGGIGGNCPSGYMYFLNSNYIHFRPHSQRNFVPIGGDRMSTNQDAVVRLIGWAGNLTMSGRKFQGLFKE